MGKLKAIKEAVEAAGRRLDDYATRIVYHGSPHDFDAFDLNKIGTGEGAQAYGHGLYFTESDDVAKTYRDGLSGRRFKVGDAEIEPSSTRSTRAFNQTKAQNIAADALDDAFNAQSNAPAQYATNRLRQQRQMYPEDSADIDEAMNILGDWEATGAPAPKSSGKLYRAEIPTADYMLDWDKPLSEQPEAVRKAIEPIVKELQESGKTSRNGPIRRAWENPDGATLYNTLASASGGVTSGMPTASQRLRDAGIVGINYIGDSSGVRNAVVFDDELIRILEKGNADPKLLAAIAAGGGAALLASQESEAGVDDVAKAAARALDMSTSARMARAAEQGFDTSRVLYHGTASDFDAFDDARRGASTRAGSASRAHWFVNNPDTAAGYADMAAKRELGDTLSAWQTAMDKQQFDLADELMAKAEQLDSASDLAGQNVLQIMRRGNVKVVDAGGKTWAELQDGGLSAILDSARREGFDGVEFRALRDDAVSIGGGRQATHVAMFDPANVRSVNAKFDPANIGKNDLMGSIDPRLLAPVAAVGAGAGYAMQQYAPPPLPPLDPAYAEFARRREAKRDTWRQLKEGVFTMGSAMAGGIVGDLSRLGGYLNPFMSVEQTEQGAQGIENAMMYQPTGPNRYLEGLGRGIEQAQEDFAPLTDQIPQSIPGRLYNALPERAQGVLRIGADLAL